MRETSDTIDFAKDLFTLRRSGGLNSYGNPYDPESLLTGEEISQGFDYGNSHREFPDPTIRDLAYGGFIPPEVIAVMAPRVFNSGVLEEEEEER